MHKWQQIKSLKAKGVGIKKIAGLVKLSKNTVKKYLRSPNPPQFKARQYERMLNEYEDRIKEMIGNRYIGTRIYSELTGMGYEGSLSTVHRYIRGIKSQEEINSKITTRVETAPGKQMQYDWKEWELPVANKTVKVYIHEAVLYWHLKEIEGYTELYGISKVLDAIDKCISIGTYHKNSVKRLLIPLPISQHNPVNTPLANLMLPAGNTKRGLSAYRVEVSHE
jgi:predicted transcriptional regulator